MSNQRVNLQSFNKEKLVFLVAALGFAWGLYAFLSSGPIPLEAGAPISQEKRPVPPQVLTMENQQPIDFYVTDGVLSRMLDPRTNKPVNRERKSPFQPAAGYLNAQNKPVNGQQPTPPPPPIPETPKTAEKKDDKSGHDISAQVEFMGVVIKNGEKYALLKPTDGSSPRRVKVGDKIDEYNYTVTKIEPQEIWIVDNEKRPFILKDREDSPAASKDEGDEAEPAPKATKKDTHKGSAKKSDKAKVAKPAKPEKPAEPKPPVPAKPTGNQAQPQNGKANPNPNGNGNGANGNGADQQDPNKHRKRVR